MGNCQLSLRQSKSNRRKRIWMGMRVQGCEIVRFDSAHLTVLAVQKSECALADRDRGRVTPPPLPPRRTSVSESGGPLGLYHLPRIILETFFSFQLVALHIAVGAHWSISQSRNLIQMPWGGVKVSVSSPWEISQTLEAQIVHQFSTTHPLCPTLWTATLESGV
jgi:hypothetical protein